ncbi:DUF2235 domain-containing protein [Variovorax sp. RHLX14]|uniref:DUF2235 domain-containing protein n=1 Tax=Variovorax sp. RHLX14 TaxID=1259731 RepID=UPI003F462C50
MDKHPTTVTSAPETLGKTICLFSDGTGNSAAKISKTNVWRMYQALDLGPPPPGLHKQIAFYDDGVGSGGGKLFMMLGGVFGFGLKRNVLDLYSFICRNYEPGDRIVAFGFSRGAFTIRLLIGLLARIGVAPYRGEQCISSYSSEMYRRYRREMRLDKWTFSDLFVRIQRGLAHTSMRRRGLDPDLAARELGDDVIRFVGVWDTVAAYGTPIAELTRGVDRWIWPLSLKDYTLSKKVMGACHALSLDDERDTFHPLLWDEVDEMTDRLKQVWFVGMHSDVGGGYPDGSLSLVPLEWMMQNAVNVGGLRLEAGALTKVQQKMNELGPMHDSRAGFAGYYRYQPRRLSARLTQPKPGTQLMQDPDPRQAHGRLTKVVVHPSVVRRIKGGTDGYRPITLPSTGFEIEGTAQVPSPATCTLAAGTAIVWNKVWQRRVAYFFAITFTILLVLMPLMNDPSDCSGPTCLVSPAVSAAGELLPGVLRFWVHAWANSPALFVGLAGGAMFLMARGRGIQRAIDDVMRSIWKRTLAASDSPPVAPPTVSASDRLIERLRTNSIYQTFFQFLKWRAVPTAFGFAVLALFTVVAITAIYRVPLLFPWTNASVMYCASKAQLNPVSVASLTADGLFATKDPCWSTGLVVQEGAQYRLKLVVDEPWSDDHGTIPASPLGFPIGEMTWWKRPFLPFVRRILTAEYFQPGVTIRNAKGHYFTFPVRMLADSPDLDATNFSGSFASPASGEVFLFVNDALRVSSGDGPPEHYGNNRGTSKVSIERLPYSALLMQDK